jgi:hypothetical protein
LERAGADTACLPAPQIGDSHVKQEVGADQFIPEGAVQIGKHIVRGRHVDDRGEIQHFGIRDLTGFGDDAVVGAEHEFGPGRFCAVVERLKKVGFDPVVPQKNGILPLRRPESRKAFLALRGCAVVPLEINIDRPG